MRLALALILVALLAAAAAQAATPAQYKARVNAVCRAYTPQLKKLQTAMTGAEASNDDKTFRAAVKRLMTLGLAQNRRLEAIPVPPALAPKVKPLLAQLRKIDAQARLALVAARTGTTTDILTHLLTIASLGTPLDTRLAALGLRDCGVER
jgi:hypothetical protein